MGAPGGAAERQRAHRTGCAGRGKRQQWARAAKMKMWPPSWFLQTRGSLPGQAIICAREHGAITHSRMWAIMLGTRRKCALRWGKCASSACGSAWLRPHAGRGNGMGQHMCIGAPARMTSGAGPTPGPKRATSRDSPREMRSRRGRVAREEAPPASQRPWPFSSLEERAGLSLGFGPIFSVAILKS